MLSNQRLVLESETLKDTIQRSLTQQKESEQIIAKLRLELDHSRGDLKKALKAQGQFLPKATVDTCDKALDCDSNFISI